jgi:hypothetical protein
MRHLSRRRAVQVGGIGLFGLTLPQLLHARAAPVRRRNSPTADACILVFLGGGPSHLDMWDPKPDAPAEVRGAFHSIPTSVPGVRLCEHLPGLARQMRHCALVRSVHHSIPNHVPGIYQVLTGHERADSRKSGQPSVDDHPAIGSVLASRRPPDKPVVPFVWLADPPAPGWFPQSGYQGGWFGAAYDPYLVPRDPAEEDFALPELGPPTDRLAERRRLLAELDGPRRSADVGPPERRMETFRERAFDLLTSANTRRAFQIEQEPGAVRDRYGRDGFYGQRLLLARRLIEAGTRMVCVAGERRWDTHNGNFYRLKQTLLPDLDPALSSLIADLASRSLLDRTLVAVMGEFGRTPRVGQSIFCGAGPAGRDHWSRCYSLLLAGGGIKPGSVYGSSDKIGGEPRTCPITPADIVATAYHCLGVPVDLELVDAQGRPSRLAPGGQPITDLLA